MQIRPRLLPEEHPPVYLLPLLIAAAMVGNLLPFQILLNIQVVFGSIFALVALQLFGLPAGALAGAIAALCTLVLWNEPYSVVVMTLEVVVAGWLHRRRGVDLLIADTIFWIVLCVPLSWLVRVAVLGHPPEIVHMIVAKGAVNGIFNALAARLVVIGLVFSGLAGPPARARVRLQELVFVALAAFVMIPSMILVGVEGRAEESLVREDARRRLRVLSTRTRAVLGDWLEDQLAALRTLALDVRPDALGPDIQKRLENLRSVDHDLVRVAVFNRDAVAVAYSPRVDALGRDTVGQSTSGSSFVELLRRTLSPGFSDVLVARIGPPVPIVVAAVPIVEGGRFTGYVAGAINVETLATMIGGLMGESHLRGTLVDGQGRVIASSRADARVGDLLPWKRGGKVQDAGDGLGQWFPDPREGLPASERIRRSFHFIEVPIATRASWRLVVESPVGPYHTALNARYAKSLAVLLAVTVVALVAAWLASRKIAASIRTVGEITAGLPDRISRNEPIAWPETPLAEARSLVENFRSAAETLSRNFEMLRSVNETLEKRIAERTASVRLANEELRREVADRRAAEAQLVASEASYRLLAENSRDLIARIAPDGATLYISPAVETLLGYRPAEVTGRNAFELIRDDEIATVRDAMDRVLRQGTASAITHRLRRKDGSWIWVETSARVVGDAAAGGSPEIVIVTRDISGRKRAEEENDRLVAQMLQSQKLESLGLLAGGIAHDFNNLLTIILGNADLARVGAPPDSPVHGRLGQIETAARRAAEMVGQMLAYSGQGKVIVRPLSLSAVVDEMASLLRTAIPKTCVLETRLGDDLPAIEADASQMQQVVMNLITNAAEAIGDRPGTITIRTDHVEAGRDDLESFHAADGVNEGSYVRLEVADTGCGMEETTRIRMFDPFFTTKFTGRGLGLAAVLGIVRGHRGALKVDSAPGRGTSFVILLPAAKRPASAAEATDRAAEPERAALSGTVLVVDDDESVLKVASSMVGDLGFNVVTARDGVEAVEAFRAQPDAIRLVLLDVAMPRMGGEAACEAIRAVRGTVPIILSSGYDLQAQGERLARTGATCFIQKPYARAELSLLVREVLGDRLPGSAGTPGSASLGGEFCGRPEEG